MEYQHQVLECFSRLVRAVASKGFILLVVAELGPFKLCGKYSWLTSRGILISSPTSGAVKAITVSRNRPECCSEMVCTALLLWLFQRTWQGFLKGVLPLVSTLQAWKWNVLLFCLLRAVHEPAQWFERAFPAEINLESNERGCCLGKAALLPLV